MTLRAHIFTNVSEISLLKQSPGFSPQVDGVEFTIGLEVPPEIDALLVYNRSAYPIKTVLPKERTIFFAGEPDDIHPYSAVYLNQFGLVHTATEKMLSTRKYHASACAMPFVGIPFDTPSNPLNLTWFRDMERSPPKDDLISIVTSTKSDTPYHRSRLTFIERLQQKIPDRIRLYGRGFKTINDKKDALLGHKYHIALENAGGRYTWTEKLADPLLCWALPFHSGCTNVAQELPADCFVSIDISKPDAAIEQIVAAQEGDLWASRVEAISAGRDLVLTEFNLMNRFAKLVREVCKTDMPATGTAPVRRIRSERSLWPEPGGRGSVPETLIRRAILAVDPDFEMRTMGLRTKARAFHRARRNRRNAKREAGLDNRED